MFERVLTWAPNWWLVAKIAPVIKKMRHLVSGAPNDTTPNNTINGKSASAAIQIFLLRIFGAILALILQIVLARWIGSSHYGVFVLVWVVATLLGSFACIGFQTAAVRFITQYRTSNDRAALRAILLAAPLISITSAIAAAGIGISLLYFDIANVNENYKFPLMLALLCLPIFALDEVQEAIARSYDMPLTAMAPTFILRPIGLLLMIAFAFFIAIPATAMTAILAAIIATILATLAQSLVLWKKISHVVSAKPTKDTKRYAFALKAWMRVALPVFLAGGFFHMQVNIDVMLVGVFLTPEKVAVYFAALKAIALVHFVQFALRSASAHHFSRYYSQNDRNGLANYARKIAQWGFWPTLVLALATVAAGKYILAMFGAEFIDGQVILAILAVGIIIRSTIGPAESLLSMAGQQNLLVIVLAITLGINVILNIVLITRFGLTGAAMATSASMIFETLALYTVIYTKLGFHLFVFGSAPMARGQEQAQ